MATRFPLRLMLAADYVVALLVLLIGGAWLILRLFRPRRKLARLRRRRKAGELLAFIRTRRHARFCGAPDITP